METAFICRSRDVSKDGSAMYTCRKGTVTAHGLQLTKVGTEAASAMMTDWCFATQGIVLTDKECDKRDKDSRRHIVLRPQLCVPAKSMTSSRKRDASTAVCDDACDDDVFDDNDNDDGDGDIHSVSTQRMKLSFYVVYCEEDGRGEHGEHGEHDDNAAHYDSDDDDTKWYSDSFLLTPFDLPIYPQRTLYFGRVTAHVEALKDYESRLAPCYFLEVASHTTRAAWGGDAAPLRFFRLPGIVREFRWETSLSQPKRWKGMFERRRVQIPTPSDRVSLLHECFDHLWEVECMDGAVDKEHAAAHASKLPSFRRHGVMRSIQRHEDMLHTSLSPNANNVGDFVNVTQVLLPSPVTAIPAATPAAAVGLSGGATDTAILARILGSDTSIILNTDPIHDKDCIGGRTCAMKSSHSGGVSGEVDADDNEDARSGREGSIMCGGSRKGRDSGVARRQHQSDGRRSHYHQPQHQHHRHQLHKPTTAGSDESDKDEEEGCDDGPSAMRKRQRYLAESIPPARVSVAMTKHRDRTHSNSMKCIDDGAGDGDEEEDEEEDVEEDDDNDEDEQEDSEDDGDGDGDSEGASEYGISDDDDDGEGDEDEDDEDEDDDDQDPGIDSDDAQDIDDDDDHDDDDDDADDDIEYDDDQADDDDDDAEEN